MIDYDVGLRYGEICKNVVVVSCIFIKYGIFVLLIFLNLWYRYFFKGEFFVVFFMRKVFKIYMYDLGYKLLVRK